MTKIGFTSKNIAEAYSGEKIILTNEDKKSIHESYQEFINKSLEKSIGLEFILLGTLLGISGGFISNGIYDAMKAAGIDTLRLSVGIAAFIFTILLVCIILSIYHQRNKIKEEKEQQKMWNKAEYISVAR